MRCSATPTSTSCCWTCAGRRRRLRRAGRVLRQTYPALPVVVVSASERTSDVIRAIDLGAMGFVPKRSSNAQLTEALQHGDVRRPVRAADDAGPAGGRPPEGDTVPSVMQTRARRWANMQHQADSAPAGAVARVDRPDAAPVRGAGAAAEGPAQQADRARAQAVGRDGQGPCGRRAARAGRQHAHPGRAGGQPDDAGWPAPAGGSERRFGRRRAGSGATSTTCAP
jgi:hypothetical protein